MDRNPAISHTDAANTALKAVRCADVSYSSHDAPIAVDAEPDVGLDNSVAIGVDGRPVISYYNSFNRWLEVAVIGG